MPRTASVHRKSHVATLLSSSMVYASIVAWENSMQLTYAPLPLHKQCTIDSMILLTLGLPRPSCGRLGSSGAILQSFRTRNVI